MANKKSDNKNNIKAVNKNISKPTISKKNENKTPDAWDILENKKGHKVLAFYRNDKIIAELPIATEVLNDILFELNQHIIVDDNIADSWTYRKPLDNNMPEYLTLMNDGKILGTLPVDDSTGKKLSKQLHKYYERKTFSQRLKSMYRNKKKTFYFASFFVVLIVGIFLYNLSLNIMGNFGITLTIF